MHQLKKVLVFTVLIFSLATTLAASKTKNTRILAFYTAKNDQAHISFVNEANNWFAQNGAKNNFIYRATNDWNRLNPDTLANYQIVFFSTNMEEYIAHNYFGGLFLSNKANQPYIFDTKL